MIDSYTGGPIMTDFLIEVTRLIMGFCMIILLMLFVSAGLFAIYYAVEFARLIPTPGIVVILLAVGVYSLMRRRY